MVATHRATCIDGKERVFQTDALRWLVLTFRTARPNPEGSKGAQKVADGACGRVAWYSGLLRVRKAAELLSKPQQQQQHQQAAAGRGASHGLRNAARRHAAFKVGLLVGNSSSSLSFLRMREVGECRWDGATEGTASAAGCTACYRQRTRRRHPGPRLAPPRSAGGRRRPLGRRLHPVRRPYHPSSYIPIAHLIVLQRSCAVQLSLASLVFVRPASK